MGGYFSDHFHVVNALAPVADTFATAGESDIINMEQYGSVTFLIMTGASVAANGVITVQAGTTVSSATNAIPFHYRTVLEPATTNTPGALTACAATGLTMTKSKANAFYIIEVKAEDLAPSYSTVRCVVTEGDDVPQVAAIVAICGAPRYGAGVDATV